MFVPEEIIIANFTRIVETGNHIVIYDPNNFTYKGTVKGGTKKNKK